METQNEGASANMGTAKEPNVLMGVLSYLGPLVIISYLVAKDEPFVKFHIKQGLVLFIIEILIGTLMPMMFYGMWSLLSLLNLATVVLSVVGIINVIQKREKLLPVVGGLAEYLKF